MPSKTKKQARLMAAAAHSPKVRKKTGISKKTAEEFHGKDKKSGILKGKRKKK